ncbi:MAG: YceH family protein [Planctomycetaceae bacterium]|nr:YceH family protein [Planctomycetaceae bacterium]
MPDHPSQTDPPPASGAGTIRPLDATERRVLGVLIEKAKTTPDQYPLSLNALVTGCNQKSNRDPVMTVDEEQVMRAVAGLRKCGAMAEVYGSGKIPRYRHLAYEWLGVEKEELAILGELLLRGEQTEGDLRGRASRMDPIADLDVLRGHLDRLADRGLVVWLSPPGRGRMLTHGLLPAEKLEKVRMQLGMAGAAAPAQAAAVADDEDVLPAPPVAEVAALRPAAPVADALADRVIELERTVADLRDRLSRLEADLGG